jgi:hypothetical protein
VERIILLIVASLLLELNFQYYDFKGKMPLSPGRLLYKDILPERVTILTRKAGKWWGRMTRGRTAVTLLPDHVMLCVPKAIEWENLAPDSMESVYKADVENVVRSVARRHTMPGVTFDENRFHYDGGGWTAYAEEKVLKMYQEGHRLTLAVAIDEYWSVGSNLICGNTYGHKEEGPEHFRAYAYTYEGEVVRAWE